MSRGVGRECRELVRGDVSLLQLSHSAVCMHTKRQSTSKRSSWACACFCACSIQGSGKQPASETTSSSNAASILFTLPLHQHPTSLPVVLPLHAPQLRAGEYKNLQEWRADIQLIWDNARQYNGEQHPVTIQAIKLQGQVRLFASLLFLQRVCCCMLVSRRPVTGPRGSGGAPLTPGSTSSCFYTAQDVLCDIVLDTYYRMCVLLLLQTQHRLRSAWRMQWPSRGTTWQQRRGVSPGRARLASWGAAATRSSTRCWGAATQAATTTTAWTSG